MRLPQQSDLPIHYLASVFNSGRVTNSYKFYWLLSILQLIRQHPSQTVFFFQHIAIQMIANVWYPIHYYRLSLGKQDKLAEAVKALQTILDIPIDTKQQEIVGLIEGRIAERNILSQVKKAYKYVPYRFLSTWFNSELRGQKDAVKNKMIAALANENFLGINNIPIYKFLNNKIEIHPTWRIYFEKHWTILESFCLWHLLNYLQKNNPNVPNIAGKLFEPKSRKLTNAKKFWANYLLEKKTINCIYSSQKLTPETEISIDHFIPWSFVSHDLIWNLLPTTKNINSSKNDSLPASIYHDKFAQLQFDAFRIASNSEKNKIILEDYVVLFNDEIAQIKNYSSKQFTTKLLDNLIPLFQIATNLGFPTNWVFQSQNK